MKDPLGVSPSKGNQGTTRGKEKFLSTSVGIEPTTSGLDLPLLCRLPTRGRATRSDRESRGRLGGESHPYFLFAASIHHAPNRPRLSLSDLVAQSAE